MSVHELFRRRVPQLTGVYLAASWALIEFSDWAVVRFGLSGRITDVTIALLLFGLPFVILVAWRLGADIGAPLGEKSVAVLPFNNLSGNSENEYLSDGLSEEIINALARVEGLRVVSRTSVFAWKGRPGDVRDIGGGRRATA